MKKKKVRNQFVKFFEPALSSPRRLFAFAMIFVFWKMYDIVNILLLQYIVKSIENGNQHLFFSYLLYFGFFVVCYHVFSFLWMRSFGFYEYQMKRNIYNHYVPLIVAKDSNEVESLGTGKLLTIIKQGVDQWQSYLLMVLMNGVGFLVVLIFACIMLARLSGWYVLLFLGLTFMFDFIAYKLKDAGKVFRDKKYETKVDGAKYLARLIMSKNEVMQNHKELEESKRIEKTLIDGEYYGKKQRVYEHLSFNSIEWGLVITKIIILYGVGSWIFAGTMSIADLVGISMVITYLSSASQSFIELIRWYMRNRSDIQKMRDFIDDTPEVFGYKDGRIFEYKSGSILIDSISYHYTNGMTVFDNFSLHLEGGKKIAFVGRSGSGKTTLIKLIAGYLHPQKGKVLIDDQSLPHSANDDHVSLLSYYKHIGYLTQEPSVFDGTIYDNLVYALDDMQVEEEGFSHRLHEVILLAQCDFVLDLPDGLYTEIGEKGIRLSGGQRQRLAIAKIMLKNPEIILLDEPTSALDSFSEEEVTKALHNLFVGRTVLIIAHRLQTVKEADDIIVMEDGKVIERGTHAQLVKKKGSYAKMLELQSGF